MQSASVHQPRSVTFILRLIFTACAGCSIGLGQAAAPPVSLAPDAGGNTACKPIVLQATVTPKAAGKVQFFESAGGGQSNLGQPQKVDGDGKATLSITLPIGTHKLGATFQPDDAGASQTSALGDFVVAPGNCVQPVDIIQVIAGVDVSAASSTNPTAVFLADGRLDIPVAAKNVRINDVLFWISGDLRIAGIAEPGSLGNVSSVTNFFSTATNTTPDKIVQSGEVASWFAIKFHGWSRYTTALDAGNAPADNPKPALFSLSGIIGGGAITPLSVNQVQSAIYTVTQPIYNCYNQATIGPPCVPSNAGGFPNADGLPSTCNPGATPPPTAPCYIAFVPQGRSRFFRHYEAGLRLKIYPHDYSDDSSKPKLRFPGNADLTIGQNEYVTGGRLHSWVVHIGGTLPVPKLDGWYAFGAGDFAISKNISEPQLLFTQAGGTVTLSSSNVFVVPTAQPNRDRYRLGVGIDLYHLIDKYKSAASAKPGT